VRNGIRTKTIVKAEDFIKLKDLTKAEDKAEVKGITKNGKHWKCKPKTSIMNVFACTRISNSYFRNRTLNSLISTETITVRIESEIRGFKKMNRQSAAGSHQVINTRVTLDRRRDIRKSGQS